ncbi:SHOCT domain-containing protein [Aeromicrobium tamlense]|uniref:SHOCT domain-containing protein n=1 Tax=Aeromicrobium tamlense TaxID=375541 RepID=A0A8I0KMG5_9ACTN|nr:SHOCT domain-containing protein [Aeromicrobium tamlense]MBD1270735.1 SHOCT domain-containing protein [Aeromicrobium tamlense]MBD1271133.1 SHOCT domain-containing protein [Aeromicrobium tamlense]NYI38127.1 hypothetical protein [Aeromicrobium tamlense]
MVDDFWDFFWLSISIFFLVAYLIVMFQVIVDLFRDRSLSGWWKAVWVFFLIVLPMVTALAYLVVRGGGMASRTAAEIEASKAEADDYIRSVAATPSPADQIASAKSLLDAGTITEQEFTALKNKALS